MNEEDVEGLFALFTSDKSSRRETEREREGEERKRDFVRERRNY